MTLRLPSGYARNTIAGQAVLDEIGLDKAATVTRHGALWESESLCRHQERMSRRGYLGAQIVQTIRGWSLRYDSGLRDWGLIVRGIATHEDAVAEAVRWQAQDPAHRYVTETVTLFGDAA